MRPKNTVAVETKARRYMHQRKSATPPYTKPASEAGGQNSVIDSKQRLVISPSPCRLPGSNDKGNTNTGAKDRLWNTGSVRKSKERLRQFMGSGRNPGAFVVKAMGNSAVSIKTPCALPCRLDFAYNETVGSICKCEHVCSIGRENGARQGCQSGRGDCGTYHS